MKMIVGLGNPGQKYQNTKHNVGFKCIDLICEKLNIQINNSKFNSEYFQGNINDEKVIILKPMTYMNLSGEAVKKFVEYFKINTEDILIIYDDLDTDIGKIRVRAKGSSGGQNGMKNIINHLHTKDIPRIRIGIGRKDDFNTKDYVLSTFSNEEKDLISMALLNACNAALDFIKTDDIDKIISKYNQK